MKKFLKENWFKLTLILLAMSAFAWYEVRPAYTKNKCSWVERHENAYPGRPATSAEEIKRCKEGPQSGRIFCDLFTEGEPSRPAKDWIEPTSPAEYQFCLHNHGI